jgi:hypothetical protein
MRGIVVDSQTREEVVEIMSFVPDFQARRQWTVTVMIVDWLV